MGKLWLVYLGPVLIVMLAGSALAQDVLNVTSPPHSGTPDAGMNYLLQFGPYGVFAWAAWMMRGILETVKTGIQISIIHKHEFTQEGIEAAEKLIAAAKERQ